MYQFLVAALILSAGCSRHEADPEELAKIFLMHSYAEADPAAAVEAFRGGGEELALLDTHAQVIAPGRRVMRDYPVKANAGAGLVLWRTRDGFLAVKVFQGSPAAAAGLRDGDRIVKLDGRSAADARPSDVILALSGEKGGEFSYEAETADGRALSGKLRRDFGSIPLAWGFMVPGTDQAYVRLISFSGSAPDRLKKELADLVKAGARSAVIDLRHNYGGSLEALEEALGLFVSRPGPVFRAVSRHKGYSKDFSAAAPGPFAGLKLVLLTDSGTVSKAEVFAASLKEAGRAVTAGGRTPGDVSVTKTFRLSRGGKLRLTVARLVTPGGLDLEGAGLAPDLPVKDPLDGEYAFAADFPPALAGADPVLAAALRR